MRTNGAEREPNRPFSLCCFFGGGGGEGETTSKTVLVSFFSSYRTVNVVPFYLAVFSILCCCYNT